jgi:hypothetical protein
MQPDPIQNQGAPNEPASENPGAQTTPQVAGQVFIPGAQPEHQPSADPASPSTGMPAQSDSLSSPQPVMSASSLQSVEEKKKRGFKPSKKIALLTMVPLLLVGGVAGAYFGYYVPNKPENVWKSALTNTGKGYDKLSNYATAKKNVQDMSAKGSFKISGTVAADGTFSGVSDGKNGQLTGSVSAVGMKIGYDVREISSPGNSPDVYFKIDGIQGLGDLVGGYAGLLGADSTDVAKALNGLNGQWYFIDHTLFDQFAKGSNNGFQITSADVSGALKAVGDSSKQYLFTNDPNKMAIVVKQDVGKEKQDGRSVYHYKVGVNKDNLKAYNKSLCDNLIKTKLFKLFENDSSGDQDLTQQCYDTTGIDKINDNQTADAWVDMHTKLFHKLRFTDSKNKNNYTDITQDYQGGDEFPFSIGVHTQDSVDSGINANSSQKPLTTSGLIKMKLNMKTNTFNADANFEDSGSDSNKGTFSLTIAPSSQTVKVDKPANAKTIIQLVNDLGFGSLSAAGTQTSAQDTTRRTDINAIASQLEVYYTDNGGYPTFKGQVNTDSWIKANLKGADLNAWRAPGQPANSMVNSATPTKDQYGYIPLQADGKTACTTAPCAQYKLYWYSEKDGVVQTKESLN